MAYQGTRVSRRSLLQLSWQGIAALGLARLPGGLRLWKQTRLRIEDVTAESFLPFVGRKFTFHCPAQGGNSTASSVNLKLASVMRHENISRIESGIPAIRGKRRRESFSLLFELRGEDPLGPGLHQLEHPDFEASPLLLSQVCGSKRDSTMYYEAVFG